ncbi:MAG: aminotransferase class III-fold pyridoxal phosphate-dependent enzyme, partial [Bradyrhizobium sp.]
KGITNGVIPMGAVFASRKVHDALMTGPENQIELFHGYTYSAHPVACAAGLATLAIYQSEGLLTQGAALTAHWQEAMHGLRGLPDVIDIRAIGLVAGIELSPRAGAAGTRAYDIMVDCFNHGLMVRVTGDTIALSPPLIVTPEQIGEMTAIVAAAIKRAA